MEAVGGKTGAGARARERWSAVRGRRGGGRGYTRGWEWPPGERQQGERRSRDGRRQMRNIIR